MKRRQLAIAVITVLAIALAVYVVAMAPMVAHGSSTSNSLQSNSIPSENTTTPSNSSPQNATYALVLVNNPASGAMTFNGNTESGAYTYNVMAGNYSVIAIPPANFIFGSWNLSSNAIFISNALSADTMLNVSGNGTVTANYDPIPPVTTTFTENGIPANAMWKVAYANTIEDANALDSITFNTIPGNYPYTVANVVSGNSIYVPQPSFGNATAGNIIQIQFNIYTTTTSTTTITTTPTTSTSTLATTTSQSTTIIPTNVVASTSSSTPTIPANMITSNTEMMGIMLNKTLLPFILNNSIFIINSTPTSTNSSFTNSLSNSAGTQNSSSQPMPAQLNPAQMSQLNALTQSQVSNLLNGFAHVLGNNIKTSVVLLNASGNVTYGDITQNSILVGASKTLHYAVYNKKHVLTIYKVTVNKAAPKLNINMDGITVDAPNTTSIVHVPILPGQRTYNISGSFNTSLLAGNSANFTYSIKFGNGTTIKRTVQRPGISLPFFYSNVPVTENVTITFSTSGNANYTAIDPTTIAMPTNINYYVPVTLTNSQSAAVPNPFQEMLTVNSLTYNAYEASNLQNVEFFFSNGTIVPSWMESGNSKAATNTVYWLRVPGNFLPASSSNTLYMGFAANTVNLLNSVSTGEAPQLSSTYGEYDDGATVFDYYNVAPSSTSGWTISGTAGVTASAPTGSHFATTNALYANSAGYYMYRSVAGLTTNTIITYWVYSTGLGDMFFLTSSSGAGQMTRFDTRGGADYSGLATASSWSSWTAPSSGLTPGTDTWYKYDTVVTPSTAAAYIGPSSDSLDTLGTHANNLAIADNGNYIGLVGDRLGSSYITYWNGMVFRAYPPNGVMPTSTFGNVISTNQPELLMTSPITYGSVDTIQAVAAPATDSIELLIDGNVVAGPTVGNAIYAFNTLAVGQGPGSYTVNAFDTNSLLSNVGTLIVNKAKPSLTLSISPANFIYTGTVATVTANIITFNNQLTANDYINGVFHTSFNTQDTFSESSQGLYTITANTPGNGNYLSASVSKTLLICQEPSAFPANIVYYACIRLNNTQGVAAPPQFQLSVSVNSLAYNAYEASNLQNVEFFFSNGTITPSWMESGNSNAATNTIYWLNVPGNFLPASSSNTLYMGFAANTITLLNSVSTGEAPQLSPTYGEYDDGANVFLSYLSGASLTGWTTIGTAGQSASAPAGNPTFGTNAFYANGANGDYLYTQAPGQSGNMIVEFYGYTANLQDLYFLASSSGAGQMIRDGNGVGWYGLASTSSWTSWAAPPDTGIWSDEWVTVGVVVDGGTATGYLSPGVNTYGSEIGSNPTNQYAATTDGTYLGLVGDAAGSTTIQYWSGIIIRAYPPNDVMPTSTFTGVASVPLLTCQIVLSPSTMTFGSLTHGSNHPTNLGVADTNSGSAAANILVYGGNWISGQLNFGVSNTLWSTSSQLTYTGTPLTAFAANTAVVVAAGGSNSIYFGLAVPQVLAGTYNQTITIENSC